MSYAIHLPSSEEAANVISHAVGLLLSVFVTGLMLTPLGPELPLYSSLPFGLALICLYGSSTLYHASSKPKLKRLFHVLDHASIFALIAGTYTAYGSLSHTPETPQLLTLIWSLALIGIVLKVFWTGRWVWASTLLYLAMGWLIFLHPQVYLHIPEGSRELLLYGGISYSAGTLFYLWKRLRFHHFFWHLSVLLGSAFHVLGICLPTG